MGTCGSAKTNIQSNSAVQSRRQSINNQSIVSNASISKKTPNQEPSVSNNLQLQVEEILNIVHSVNQSKISDEPSESQHSEDSKSDLSIKANQLLDEIGIYGELNYKINKVKSLEI